MKGMRMHIRQSAFYVHFIKGLGIKIQLLNIVGCNIDDIL